MEDHSTFYCKLNLMQKNSIVALLLFFLIFLHLKLSNIKVNIAHLNTVHGKNLEGENFGESLLMKQMAKKILANILVGLQLFHCIYNYWRGKIWRIIHHSPNSPKFSPSKFFPCTVQGIVLSNG